MPFVSCTDEEKCFDESEARLFPLLGPDELQKLPRPSNPSFFFFSGWSVAPPRCVTMTRIA